jgi:hypothetical protein
VSLGQTWIAKSSSMSSSSSSRRVQNSRPNVLSNILDKKSEKILPPFCFVSRVAAHILTSRRYLLWFLRCPPLSLVVCVLKQNGDNTTSALYIYFEQVLYRFLTHLLLSGAQSRLVAPVQWQWQSANAAWQVRREETINAVYPSWAGVIEREISNHVF